MELNRLLMDLKELPSLKLEIRKVNEEQSKLEKEIKKLQKQAQNLSTNENKDLQKMEEKLTELHTNSSIIKRSTIFEYILEYMIEDCKNRDKNLYELTGHGIPLEYIENGENKKLWFSIYINNKDLEPGYVHTIPELQHIIEKDGKKYYMRISIADLANMPE